MSKIINKVIKDIEDTSDKHIFSLHSSYAFIYYDSIKREKRAGIYYEPHFGECLNQPLCIPPFFPWKRVSFFSELRTKEEFEKHFKENWKQTLETKVIASSLTYFSQFLKMAEFQNYIVEKEDNTLEICVFMPVIDKEIVMYWYPVDDDFIEDLKKNFEPFAIICKNEEIVNINCKNTIGITLFKDGEMMKPQCNEFYALEFSFEYKEESTD